MLRVLKDRSSRVDGGGMSNGVGGAVAVVLGAGGLAIAAAMALFTDEPVRVAPIIVCVLLLAGGLNGHRIQRRQLRSTQDDL